MGTEAQPVVSDTTAAATANAAPAATPPAEAPKANGVPAQAAAPSPSPVPASVAPVERVPTRKLISDTDDEIPDNAELLEMSPRNLKGRMERYSKKQLKERFGVDDFDQIKAQLAELDAYKKNEEDKRLAQLTETDRLKEQLLQSEAAREKAETRARDLQESRIIESEDRRVMNIAAKYLDPDYIDTEIPRLAKFLYSCTEDELRNADDVIDAWFKHRVEEKPKLGKDYGGPAAAVAGTTAATPPVPVKVAVNNGVNAEKPANGQQSGLAFQKTAAPGKANSMTESEVKEYKRQHGLHW